MISTQRGNVPIVDVKVGDKVLTSQGYKDVLMQWDNGEKLVYEYTLEFEGKHIVVTATPEHKIKTTKGWKELRQLKEGDVLFLQQSSMEELTTSTKGQGISHSTIRNSIERFGSFTMGIFRKAFTYTIWMVIALITPLITLFAYLRKTISSCTKKIGEKGLNQKSKFSISKLFRRKPSCGTKAKKVESGTSSMRDRLSLNNIIAFVSCVVRSMSQKRKALYIAVMRIMQKQGVLMETIIYKWIARFVEQPLSQTDIEAQKLVANKSVLKSVSAELKGQRRVYDLTVEEIHEYYANGVLVHNCLDAANYGCVTHLRRMRVANKIGEN